MIREDLAKLIREEYEGKNIVVDPAYPQVLVRVLPKGLKTSGGLFLPDTSNKPIYEGQVLSTYRNREVDGKPRTCSVVRGDHVLFSHYVGAPVPDLCGVEWKKGEYRLIKEEDLLACLYLEEESEVTLRAFVTKIVKDKALAIRITKELLSAADIVFLKQASSTKSGA